MEQILYERPREKLRYRGAKSLSVAELFQIVIGSGNSKTSVGKIARGVVDLVNSHSSLMYEDLLKVNGVGDAKATQILAVIELANRLKLPSSHPQTLNDSLNLHKVKKSTKQLIVCVTYDGSGAIIKTRQFENGVERYRAIIRRMFAEVIADSAAAIEVWVGWSGQKLAPSLIELNFIKDFVESAAVLNVAVKSLWFVNNNAAIDIKGQGL